MDRRRFLSGFGGGVLAVGLLSACGGQAAAPVKTDGAPAKTDAKPAAATSNGVEVPLFKEAKPLAANDPMAAAIDAAKTQLKQQPDVNLNVEAYTLPGGVTFDQVKQYYTDELGKRGWKNASS